MALREQKKKVKKTIATGEKAEYIGTEAGNSADLLLEAGKKNFLSASNFLSNKNVKIIRRECERRGEIMEI